MANIAGQWFLAITYAFIEAADAFRVQLAEGTSLIGKVGIQVGGADVSGANPVPIKAGTGETLPITGMGSVQASPEANTLLARLKDLADALAAGIGITTGTNTIGATKDAGPNWTSTHTIVNSADMTGAADVSPAPTAGQKIVITDVIISVGTAMALTLLEETSGTVVGGPYYLSANSTLPITPRSEWKLATADRKLRADASAAGNITVETWTHSEA